MLRFDIHGFILVKNVQIYYKICNVVSVYAMAIFNTFAFENLSEIFISLESFEANIWFQSL